MKLSKHSKERMKERTPFNHKERMKLFQKALVNGDSPNDIKDEKIKNYLKSKEKFNSKAKLYKGYIFIHSRRSKQLYTMYELPDKLKGEEKNGNH